MFGDVATEVLIRTDGDEGLFASYSDVQFVAAVQGGDVLEATATVIRVGRRSRELAFEARVVCRAEPGRGTSAAAVLPEPLVCTRATGTVVVPAAAERGQVTGADLPRRVGCDESSERSRGDPRARLTDQDRTMAESCCAERANRRSG